jgi:hypothetical protein
MDILGGPEPGFISGQPQQQFGSLSGVDYCRLLLRGQKQ